MIGRAIVLFLLSPLILAAGSVFAQTDWTAADVVILGEVHDNPDHHAVQADIVRQVRPAALVLEMLTPDQAESHVPGGGEAELAAAFAWAESGWPDFAFYYPIFAAAPEARVFGANVPRAQARVVMEQGLGAAFGADAEAYGASEPLPAEEKAVREAFQFAAHCDALPEHLLPMMVDMQRLRDAELARQTARALAETGGPVAVITGNGHAREDWGMPVTLARVLPETRVITLGQGEAGRTPEGVFDVVLSDAPRPDRDDPCAAFR